MIRLLNNNNIYLNSSGVIGSSFDTDYEGNELVRVYDSSINPLKSLHKLKKKYLKDLQYLIHNNNRLFNYNLKIKIKNKYSKALQFYINKIFNSITISPIYTNPNFKINNQPSLLINKYIIILESHLEYLNINMDVNNEVLLYLTILDVLIKLKMHNFKFLTSLINIKNNWNLYINNDTLKVRNYIATEDYLEIEGNSKNNYWIKEFETKEALKKKKKTFDKVDNLTLKNRTLIQRINNNYEKCSICLETLAPGDDLVFIKKHYCGNKFHLKCIIKWQKINKTCPLCRGDEFKDEDEDEDVMNIRPLFTNSSDEDSDYISEEESNEESNEDQMKIK